MQIRIMLGITTTLDWERAINVICFVLFYCYPVCFVYIHPFITLFVNLFIITTLDWERAINVWSIIFYYYPSIE
jgi:hypothetical protein